MGRGKSRGEPMAFFVIWRHDRPDDPRPRVRMRHLRYFDRLYMAGRSIEGITGPFGYEKDAQAWIAENFRVGGG